jgi:uncharacterized protein YraI
MRKQFLKLALVTALMALLTLTSSAQVGAIATVNQDLTLRTGAGTQWRIQTVMPAGTAVALDGRTSGSDWVRGITQNGEVGWMYAPYLNITTDAINALPVIAREAPLQVSAPAEGAQPSSPSSAPGEASSGGSGTSATATARVNMRSGPGTGFNRVGLVEQNGALNLDGRDPLLEWVRGVNSAGTVGWVSAEFINLNFDQVAALPIVQRGTPFNLETPGGGAPAQAQASTQDSAPPAAAPVASNAPVRGFAYGGHARGLSTETVNAMRTAGMTWVKYQVRYNQGDNPAGAANLIGDAHAKGFRILLGVVGDPGQVNNGGYNDAYAGFAAGLAAAGADAIEIWNEPNLDREWPAGQIDPAMYTRLLAASYNAIKAQNPNTLVISGAPAPTGAEAAFPGRVMNDDRYLRGMVNAGALNYMDCLGAHYNEGIVPPTWTSGDPRSEYYTRYYPSMVNVYADIINNRRPICFTELGYLTPEGYGGLPSSFSWASNVTVAQQAAWLDSVIAQAAADRRVRLVIVWNVDFKNYGADPMAGFAMIRPGGGCPACEALGN